MNRMLCCALGALSLTLALPVVGFAADPPTDSAKPDDVKKELKVIKPGEAKDYEGKEVVVEFKVAAGLETASGVCFLNNTSDREDPERFTAFISKKGLTKFKEDPKTEKPAEYFKKKTIRVTGPIKTYNKTYEIEVNSPDQIKIVEEEKSEKKS